MDTTNGAIVAPDKNLDALVASDQVQQFVNLVKDHLQTYATSSQISMSRANLGTAVGFQYGDKRDIFKAAGYRQIIEFEHYLGFYERNSVAKRVVDAPPNATWLEPPTIEDGTLGETEFTRAWESLVNFGQKPGTVNDQKTIWHYLHRGDVLAGIGRYGGLVIGVKDGQKLSEPLEEGSHRSPSDLLYLSPYDEFNLVVGERENSTQKRRFGLPKTYSLTISADLTGESDRTGSGTVTTGEVHWSRVIHIAEGLKNDEVFGTPRMEAVFNLLEDLLKVTAASGESAWQLMNKGLIASTRDGYSLPEDTDDVKAAMTDFMNELQKVLQLQGMEVTIFGGEIVDPTGVVKSIISLISATTGIPQRILLGAEAGELASSMDEVSWAKVVMSRQVNFAEAVILRPLINRLIFVGLLPPPKSGEYQVIWASQLQLTDLEKAELLSKEMAAMSTAVGEDKLPVETFLREMLDWSDDQIKGMNEARRQEFLRMIEDFPGTRQ